MKPLARALPIANLPSIPYTLPKQNVFKPESSGAFRKSWLRGLPSYRKMAENARYLPSHDDFWRSSPTQAMAVIASRMSYHDIIHSAALDGILPIDALLRSPGAPTPDVIYEDLMRWKTLSDRLQKPPEEQYHLEPRIMQQLLAQCAHLVMLDPEYFVRAEIFFRKIEQQQNIGSTAYSCWALMCIASSRITMALDVLSFMDTQRMSFDQYVFILCINPGAADFQHRIRGGEKSHKGFVRQLRLLNRLSTSADENHIASTPAIHAFFVMLNLTLNHIKKWEFIRCVVADARFIIAMRTRRYIASMVGVEGARRCGPLTVQALLILFAMNGEFTECARILSRVRQNEAIEEHTEHCPVVIFREHSIREIEKHMYLDCRQETGTAQKSESVSVDSSEWYSFDDMLFHIDHEKSKSKSISILISETQKRAEENQKVACAWVSLLMRIQEHGIPSLALRNFFAGLNHTVEQNDILPPSASENHELERKAPSFTRRIFLHRVLRIEPLKSLKCRLKSNHSNRSPRKTSEPTNRSKEFDEPSHTHILPNFPSESTQAISTMPMESPEASHTSTGKVSFNKQQIRRRRFGSSRKNYVEEIPASNNPFEQDEEQKQLMERVKKRQETQTDIDHTQNKQAVNQLYEREKEKAQRIRRLPQAWTFS